MKIDLNIFAAIFAKCPNHSNVMINTSILKPN